MTSGVSRDINDADARAKNFEIFTLGDTRVSEIQRFLGWSEDFGVGIFSGKPVHSTDMVAVVMRDQYAGEFKLMV